MRWLVLLEWMLRNEVLTLITLTIHLLIISLLITKKIGVKSYYLVILGILLATPITPINGFVKNVFGDKAALYVIVPLVEEFFKVGLALALSSKQNPSAKAMYYGASIAAGFSLIESLVVFANYSALGIFSIETFGIRLLSLGGHIGYTIVGVLVARNKKSFAIGLISAALLHGMANFINTMVIFNTVGHFFLVFVPVTVYTFYHFGKKF